MAEDNLDYKISADADDAIRDTQKVSQEQQNLASETDQAGQTAEEAGRQQTRLGQAVGGVGRQVRGMVRSWMGFTAIGGAILALFQGIRRESEEALDSVTELGNEVRDLSVNLGENADRITDHASAISRTEDQRKQLLDFATEMTDRRPELAADPVALERQMERVAPVALATGARGDEIARTMVALEEAGFRRPADAAAMFMTGALEARDIERIAQSGGREGLELTEAMIRTGTVDPRRARRQLPRIFGELTETDEMGRPDEDLRELGITQDMDLVERLRLTIEAVRGEDPERRGIARDIIGADRVREMAPALEQALAEGGTLAGVREDVESVTARQLEARAMESERFRRSIEQQEIEFREQLRTESESRAERAREESEVIDRIRERIKDQPAADREATEKIFHLLAAFGADPETLEKLHEMDLSIRQDRQDRGILDAFDPMGPVRRRLFDLFRQNASGEGGNGGNGTIPLSEREFEQIRELLPGLKLEDIQSLLGGGGQSGALHAGGQTITNHNERIINVGEQYNNATDPETEGSEMVPRPD